MVERRWLCGVGMLYLEHRYRKEIAPKACLVSFFYVLFCYERSYIGGCCAVLLGQSLVGCYPTTCIRGGSYVFLLVLFILVFRIVDGLLSVGLGHLVANELCLSEQILIV